jgi:hypothetical protein
MKWNKKRWKINFPYDICRNPSLGLMTKARACKVVGQEGSPRVTSRAPGSAKEWEGMNLHTPKWIPIVKVGVSNELPNFQRVITRVKTHWFEEFFISLESYWNLNAEMGLHDPFGHLKHKLWPKKWLRVKLAFWLSITKNQESTWFPCVQVACNMPLESSQSGLQLFFRPHCNQRFAHKVMGPQNRVNLNSGNFGTPILESQDKMSFGCGPRGEAQSIL